MRIKPGSLKPSRTDPKRLSLIRERIGRSQAKEAARDHVHGPDFWGFGFAEHPELLAHGDSLDDDREHFLGHANLTLSFDIPRGENGEPPEMNEEYKVALDKLAALADTFAVVEDPSPESEEWDMPVG